MKIFLNLLGFIYLMIGLGPLMITLSFTRDRIVVLAVAVIFPFIAAGIDYFKRNKAQTTEDRNKLKFIKPSSGGHIMFVPSWIFMSTLAAGFLVIYLRSLQFN